MESGGVRVGYHLRLSLPFHSPVLLIGYPTIRLSGNGEPILLLGGLEIATLMGAPLGAAMLTKIFYQIGRSAMSRSSAKVAALAVKKIIGINSH